MTHSRFFKVSVVAAVCFGTTGSTAWGGSSDTNVTAALGVCTEIQGELHCSERRAYVADPGPAALAAPAYDPAPVTSETKPLAPASPAVVPPKGTSERGSLPETAVEARPAKKPVKPVAVEPLVKKDLDEKPVDPPSVQPDKASAAIPAVEEKPVVVPVMTWTLTAGNTVGRELQAWGQKCGWKVIWNMPQDWSVPAAASFFGDFESAAAEVITTLAGNGALVRAQFFQGNRTMVVTGPGTSAQ
jgi:hypothetical protein